jgi:protein subunit release factor A
MLEPHLLTKLSSIDRFFQELTSKLEGRDILTQPELQQIFKDIAAIEETVDTFHLWQKLNREMVTTDRLLQELATDRELQTLVTSFKHEAILDRITQTARIFDSASTRSSLSRSRFITTDD